MNNIDNSLIPMKYSPVLKSKIQLLDHTPLRLDQLVELSGEAVVGSPGANPTLRSSPRKRGAIGPVGTLPAE